RSLRRAPLPGRRDNAARAAPTASPAAPDLRLRGWRSRTCAAPAQLLLCITIHGDVALTRRIARAAEHADAVEIHGDVAASVYGDHAPFAAAAAQLFVDQLAHRLRERQVPVL